MGKKSEKKVRSDRINILRKKYDSFLEEDKKRKERNEYILQRLDKMRYTTSTGFPHRAKVFADYNQPSYTRIDYRPENVRIHDAIPMPHTQQQINQPNLQLDIPRQFDDISILREISKKYILIPKSRTFIPDNYVVEALPPHDNKPAFLEPKSDTVDNGDWRSKYDILEQLKNKEKEEDNKLSDKKEAMANNEQNKEDKNNIKTYEMLNLNKYEDLPNKYETELPEKDLPSNNFLVENELPAVDNLQINDNLTRPETNIGQYQNHPEINSDTYKLPEQLTNIDSNVVEHNVAVAENVPYISQQEQNTVYDEQNVQEHTGYSEGNEQLTEYQNYSTEYEQQTPAADPLQEITPQSQETDIYVDQNDYSPIQTVNPSELVQEIHNESEVKDDKDTTESEYPIDVINAAEFTPQDHVQLQDGININPEYVPIQETYDAGNVEEYVPIQETYEQGNLEGYETSNKEINDQHNIVPTAEQVDNSGIEAFDTEQKEMFYSEQQQGEYAYDQQAGGDAYDPEYVQNEPHQENPDYNYYTELDQQEAYPVEVNEHDETNQRYDPSYEQQYAPTQQQDYVVPQEYEQHLEPNQLQYEQNQLQYEQNPQQYEQNSEQYEQNPQQYEQNPQQFEQNPQQYEQNQQQFEQNQQEYEQPALYEQTQQGFEQQNVDTTQHVEKVLDKEEGYVEQKKKPAVQKKVAKGAAKQKT